MADINDIKSKAVRGSVWSFIEKFSLQIVQFIIGTVLARLLEPKDYGLIALTTIFTGISTAIIDGGFEKALIQRKELSPITINTAFYLNALLGILITVILVLTSPAIASFFDEPGLTTILQVISLGLIIDSLGQVQRTLLIKELNFKKVTYSQIVSSVAGGIAGITFAIMGFGVWSLVYSGLIAQLIRAAFYWIKSDWYPTLKFSFASIRDILPYGINVLFTSILFFGIQQFNNLIVGKFYSREQLGLFNRGSKLPELALGILQSVVVKMSFPLFSKLQDDNLQLKNALRKTIRLVGFVAVPLLVLLFLNAEDLTILLFTEKWRGSVIFLECFCIIKFFEPFISIQRELILARGKSRLLLWLFIITSAFEIILAVFIVRYGIMYIVLATFLSRLVQYFVYTTTVAKDVQIAWYSQLQWILPYLLNAAVVFGVVKGFDYIPGMSFINDSLLVRIAFKTGLGIGIYYLIAYKFKFSEVELIKNVANMFLKKANSLFRRKNPLTSAGRL